MPTFNLNKYDLSVRYAFHVELLYTFEDIVFTERSIFILYKSNSNILDLVIRTFKIIIVTSLKFKKFKNMK